jgi:hypothetical protein
MNRRARFPAAPRVGVLRIASAPDLTRPPNRILTAHAKAYEDSVIPFSDL